MEENKNPEIQENVTPEPESNVVPAEPQNTEIASPTPITEKLETEMEKQNIEAPPIVTETAEAAINAASAATGEAQPDPKKVSVKKPTKRDPIVMYNNNVVMWFIPID